MQDIIVIIDDIKPVSKTVKRILNKEKYSEIVLKKIKLVDLFERQYKEYYNEFYLVKSELEKNQLENNLKSLKETNKTIVYIPSNMVVVNDKLFVNLLKKIRFLNDNIILDKFIKIFKSINDYFNTNKFESIEENMLLDLSVSANFFKFISNEADVRHFNALTTDGYTFVKSSTQKNKIKSEYSFYYLLPDNMKVWFVQPFEYVEDDSRAYYRMERFRIPDSAIYHVNESFSFSEFKEFIDKLMYFVKLRGFKQKINPQTKQKTYPETLD